MKPLKRRAFLKSLGATFLLSPLLSTQAKPQPSPQKRPNIVWIYSDDHAQNAVSAYGGRLAQVAPTPHIDRIAREGVLFQNSFVTNSICGPCRAVVLTGKHSHINGFRDNSSQFDGNQQTFPKLLQAAGYQTAIFGNWHLITKPTGFDKWEILPGQGAYYNPDFITPEGQKREPGYVTDLITNKALDWLKNQRDSAKPFLLMVQHKAPHREWQPGPKHLTAFDKVHIPEPPTLFDTYEGRGTAAKQQDMTISKTMRLNVDLKVWPPEKPAPNTPEHGAWSGSLGRLNKEQLQQWQEAYNPKNEAFRTANPQGKELVQWKYQRYMQDYLACIRSVDENVGRVLDYLRDSGLERDTVVFYSSDQSFYLGEHGWFDKRFIYEESLRTPLVARWPGVIQSGATVTELVQNLDCAETFLDLAGLPIPGDMQGNSLLPLMKGEKPANWRKSIYYHYYEGEKAEHKVYRHYGVRTERFKLVYFYPLKEWEFYDLDQDPQEMKNEYDNPAYAAQVAELQTELQRLRTRYRVPEETEG
jgi:arylsulfatase A-like enzyme